MAQLRRDARAAREEPTVDHDAPADPGAERQEHEASLAGTRSMPVFAPGRRVRVVVDDDRQLQALRQVGEERPVTPIQDRRVQHPRAVGIEQRRGRDARRHHARAALGGLLARSSPASALDRIEGAARRRATGRGQRASATTWPMAVDEPGGELGAAEVDADDEVLLRPGPGRLPVGRDELDAVARAQLGHGGRRLVHHDDVDLVEPGDPSEVGRADLGVVGRR